MIRLGKFPEDNFELLFSFLLHMWLNMKNMSNSTTVVFLLLKIGILFVGNESNQVREFYFLKPILLWFLQIIPDLQGAWIFEIILSFSILFLYIPWEHGSITFDTTSPMIWKTCARVFAAHFCITWSWRPTYIWLTLLIFGTITFI